MELWLTLIGILFTAAFGVLALLVEFKDKHTDRITAWGKSAVAGIVCASAISCGLAVYKDRKDEQAKTVSEKRAEEAQERYDKLQATTNRLQFPLKDMTVAARFSVPADDPRVRDLSEKILAEGRRISSLPESQQDDDTWLKNNRLYLSSQGHVPKHLMFHRHSPILPRDDEAWIALDAVLWSIDIFKSENVNLSTNAPDLGFSLNLRIYSKEEAENNYGAVQFDYEPRRFLVFTPSKKIDTFRDFSDKIVGVWDLPGSTIVIRGSTMAAFNNQTQLESVSFTTTTGQNITVLGKDFEKRQLGRDYCYVHKFNSDPDGFRAYYINTGRAGMTHRNSSLN